VIALLSLTKPASPSLRVGAVIGRGPVMQRLRAMRLVDDFFVSRPLQEAAVELLTTPAWDRHLRSLATSLRERCAAMIDGLAHELPRWRVAAVPRGGLHLWVELPDDVAEVEDRARAHGVAIHAGHGYFASETPGRFVRLTFSAPADLAEMTEGLRRLRRLDSTAGSQPKAPRRPRR
jgi:DNA-binding transcriptional MocR family regulator